MADFPALLVSGDLISSGNSLNGRRWAGKTLLSAWASHLCDRPLELACSDSALARSIEPLAREAGHTGHINAHSLVDPAPFAAIGGLFIPDPSIGRWARWRNTVGSWKFSLIGQIHTLNTPASLAHLEALATEPIQPWDSVICTSSAGRAVVEAVLNDREAQLQQRFRVRKRIPRPQLPVIPLPIPVEAMQQALPDRQAARQQLHIPANAHVCLWLGRLSMLTKIDPWPSYQLLQLLATNLKKPLWMIECGPDDTPEQGVHFAELRKKCPDVNFLRLGGAQPVDEGTKHQALAASDVALSLVENCQETFGLSIIEAMAAGLPVLASDWDGYRDSVRDGIDGFLVPTRWAPGSQACSFPLGWQQQLELLSFPMVSGALAQLVQVDMETAYACLATLLSNPQLARAMGQQARLRATKRFCNSVVMNQYLELFGELEDLRRNAQQSDEAPQPPLSLDPVALFKHFASNTDDDAWPEPKRTSAEPLALRNRQALWQPLLQAVEPQHRGSLQSELLRKHL